MNLTTFLKKQFEDFVEVYRKYLLQTSGITLTFTLICFVVIALLLRFSDFDQSASKRQFSLLSYFFVRYSNEGIYSIVDLSKTVFIFFVSVFSLGLTRIQATNKENAELKISDFLKQIFLKDIVYFFGLLLLCSAIDYGLYQIDFLSLSSLNYNGLSKYFHGLLYQCRIYIPLLLFALTTYRLSSDKKLNVDFKKSFFLLFRYGSSMSFPMNSQC